MYKLTKGMKSVLLLFSIFFFISCSSDTGKTIKIAADPWIGYSPLIYIDQKGWLNETHIQVIPVISLIESTKLMESGIVDGMGATQQEYNYLNQTMELAAVSLLDRSYGADAIFSNRNIEFIKNYDKVVDVYLERGSINELMLEIFLQSNEIDKSKVKLINADQYMISRFKMREEPTILISYEPYIHYITKNGYEKIATSADDSYLIFDAIFVRKNVFSENKIHFKMLDNYIRQALSDLKKDPKAYYDVVSKFLDGQSYEDFLDSLKGIKWIHGSKDKKVLEELSKQGVIIEDF